MTADTFYRLCMRTADHPDAMAGSVIRPCDRCDASVWVDTLQRLPAEVQGLPEQRICIPCARADPDFRPEIEWLENNPAEVHAEFLDMLRNRKGRPKPP